VLDLTVMTHDARFRAYAVGGESVLLLFRRGATLETVRMPGGTIPPHDGYGPLHLAFAIARDALPQWEERLREHGVRLRAAPNGHVAATASISAIRTDTWWSWQHPACGRFTEHRAIAKAISRRQPGDLPAERSSQRQIRCYLRENLSESSLPGLEPGQKEKQMASPRPRPQVIRLTDAAAERIKFVMANALEPVVAVRVGVKNGGCAGMAYTMEYAERVEKADEVVEDKGVRVLIDPKAVLFLLGTEMDYKTDKLSAQFVFNNPNQTSACGCGESVQLKPAADGH
jgi:iron-sulfur cluster assembly protein